MGNYQQPDFRNPTLPASVFVFETEVPIVPGPGFLTHPSQADYRNPSLKGSVLIVESEVPLVLGPGGPAKYVQPGT